MSALSHIAVCLCYISVAVTVISLFLPQKRTRKIFGFVIGLFVICSLIACIDSAGVSFEGVALDDVEVPEPDREDYHETVRQMTADNLVSATDELLRSEGIEAEDIRISLKISDEGRIYVDDVVIYISEDDLLKKQEIERIVYGNLSKEPRVYVEKEEARGAGA